MAAGRRWAIRFIILMGVVSLLGDVTYEGGRSVTGPYLALLGASAAAVGFFTGFGEFLGYFIRLFSGLFADRTKAYWPLTFLGYGLILAIPFLGLVHAWPWAVACLVLERIGKAIRSPARDAILSYATKGVGRGFGFAIHEAMDQIGAIVGPLFLSFTYALTGNYRAGFLFLFIPAFLVLAVLASAKNLSQNPEKLEDAKPLPTAQEVKGLKGVFWFYAAFTFFSALGFTSFPLIAFHMSAKAIVAGVQIPILYAIAMGLDGVAALVVGKAYDKMGLRILFSIPLLTILTPFFVFGFNGPAVVAGVIIWGIVMGIHETIMRAALADLTSPESRGSAYGLFNTLYGLGCLLGGGAIGLLYQTSPAWISGFVIVTQVAAAFCLLRLSKDHLL